YLVLELIIQRYSTQTNMLFFLSMRLLSPRSTLFPYTTLFRSVIDEAAAECAVIDPGEEAGRILHEIAGAGARPTAIWITHAHLRSEEHTSELQSRGHLVCRLLLEKKK